MQAALLGAMFLTPLTLYAQQGTGVLTGVVLDADSKKPLEDVVVTVTSPALQGEQVVVTDAAGLYRLPSLPPGVYLMRLESDRYRPYSRGEIQLRPEATLRLNAELLPESLTEKNEVVVVGRAPTIDLGSASTGANMSNDFASRVPLVYPGGKGSEVRSFEAVAIAAPGARSDVYGTSLAGATSPENGYLIDGLSVGNPAVGVNGTPLSIEFVKDTSVLSSGYLPEYGRATGGIISAVTKSGSNEFRSTVFGNVTPGSFEGKRTLVPNRGSVILTEPRLDYMADVGGDVGGPILRDKLWFYAGLGLSRKRYELRRTLNAIQTDANGMPIEDGTGALATQYIPGTESTAAAQIESLQLITKLNYAVNRDNQLSLTFFTNPTRSGGSNLYGIDPRTGLPETTNLNGDMASLAHRYSATSINAIAKWTSSFDNKRVLFDTTLGVHHESGGHLPLDGSRPGSAIGLAARPSVTWNRSSPNPYSIAEFETQGSILAMCEPRGSGLIATDPVTRCPVASYITGGSDVANEQSLARYQAQSIVTYLLPWLGHHVIKAGAQVELTTFEHKRAYPGGRVLSEWFDGQSFLETRQFGYLTGTNQPVYLPLVNTTSRALLAGGFLQDSFNIMDRVTLNAGLRYDAEFMYAPDGTRALSLPNQWAPRAGLIWDPTQAGRAKIYGNYARYYQAVPLTIMDRLGGGEPQVVGNYQVVPGCDYHDPAAVNSRSACRTDAARIAHPYALPPDGYAVTAQGRGAIDPDVKPPAADEISFGGEYEILENARLGLSWVHRTLTSVLEDMSRDGGATAFVGNPGRGIARDFPEAERRYDAVTLLFQKSFTNHWLAQGSYTVSYLRGNYGGLFRAETNQLDPNMSADFDLRELLVNRTGALPGDRTHAIRLFGAKDFPFLANHLAMTGIALTATSGAPQNALGASALYGPNEVFLVPRGSLGRLPWTFGADLRLGYQYEFAKNRTIGVNVDVFNILNFQGVTARDETYTQSYVRPTTGGTTNLDALQLTTIDGKAFDHATEKNKNYGNTTAYQAPRTFRFGLRVTF